MRCFFGVRNNSTFEFGNTGRQGGRGCPFKDVKVLVQVSAKCQPKPIASDLKSWYGQSVGYYNYEFSFRYIDSERLTFLKETACSSE